MLSILPLFSFRSAFIALMLPFCFFRRSAIEDSSSSVFDFLSFLASTLSRLISFKHLWFLYLSLSCSNLVVRSLTLICGDVSGGDFLFFPLGEAFFFGGDVIFFSLFVNDTLLRSYFIFLQLTGGFLKRDFR